VAIKSLPEVQPRQWRKALQRLYKLMASNSSVLEIGATKSPITREASWKLVPTGTQYSVLDLNINRVKKAFPEMSPDNIYIQDLHECTIPDNTFDVVISIDVLEHVERPWICAEQIQRITKPGGYIFTVVPWSWRYHPCPMDYWRFSPKCLESLFSGAETVERGFDYTKRRNDIRGFWPSGADRPPIDDMGGWRENVESFLTCRVL